MVEKKRTETATANAEAPARSSGDAPLAKTWTTQKARVSVAKAYKMFVVGAFVRSESGHYFQVEGARGSDADPDPETVNVPRGSRKDVRDAVLVAKNADGRSGPPSTAARSSTASPR